MEFEKRQYIAYGRLHIKDMCYVLLRPDPYAPEYRDTPGWGYFNGERVFYVAYIQKSGKIYTPHNVVVFGDYWIDMYNHPVDVTVEVPIGNIEKRGVPIENLNETE